MKSSSLLKKVSIALLTLVASATITATAHAIPYTGDTTVASPVPAFNVFTGNIGAPAPAGGEQNFYQGRVPVDGNLNDANTQYTNPLSASCTNGQVIQLHVYVHNGASTAGNNNGTGPSVAHNTKLKVSIPGTTASSFDSTATISASNAATVMDDLNINCNGQTVQLQYIPGSASQYSAGSGVLGLSDAIVGTGVPIQSEKVPGDVWGCWNERVYVVLAVKVVVPPTPPKPPVVPTYMCTELGLVADKDRTVKVSSFSTKTANGAVFNNAVINWGDNSTPTTTSDVVGQTHQYAKDGTYVVSAVAHFTADGKDVTSGGANCEQQVTFTSTKPPVVTPPTTPVTPAAPTSLVNTGPGSTIALFAAATIAGTVIYNLYLKRRLSRQ